MWYSKDMEVGNFLGKFKGSDQTDTKNFLALLLTDEVVQAAVWHVVNDQTEILAIGTPVEWDGDTGTTSELVTSVDATISSALEGLDLDPNEVILGIPHSWTDKTGILGVKKELINKIRSELELKALGYVEITSSILSYLKSQEGTPTTSILIQVFAQELTLVLVRLGRIEAIEVIGRGEDFVSDVTEGIARFKIVDNLPSRIILFNSMHNLDDLIQHLLGTEWPAEFNFLHIPKIESLPKDVAIRALAVAGGAEVAKSLGIAINPVPLATATSVEESPAGEAIDPEPAVAIEETPPISDTEILSAQDFGFVEPGESPLNAKIVPERKPPNPHLPKISLPRLKMPNIAMPKFNWNLHSLTSKPKLLALLASLLVFSALLYYFIWTIPSAMVTVQVTPKPLEESIDLTLSTIETSINFADRIVPANIEVITESGEQMIETTGTKVVGDPATGEVTIYNRTSATKTFTKGTQLVGSGGLKFSLDEDVSVASKSAGSDYVDVPGRSTAKITAVAIGKESNLSANNEFSIASFGKDSYVAKNENAFSGGTSEEVRVVSKDDQTTLLSDLTKSVLEAVTAKATQNSEAGVGVYVLPGSGEVDTLTYSAKVGEQANSLSANLTLKSSVLKYQIEDVTTLVNSSIDQAVPDGYLRSDLPSTVELAAVDVEEADQEVKGTAKVQVALLPIVDTSALTQAIKGKKANAIEDIFKSRVLGYVGATIETKPTWIPTRLKQLPLNPERITLTIIPDQLWPIVTSKHLQVIP